MITTGARGAALRAELRRICSVEYVMPPPPPAPEPPPEPVRKPYERKLLSPERIAKMRATAAVKKARALAARPPGFLNVQEIAARLNVQRDGAQLRLHRHGIKPASRDVYAWYRVDDLRAAGIL